MRFGRTMFGRLLLLVLFSAQALCYYNDTAAHQLALYSQRTRGSIDILTTSAGQPVEFIEATETLNSNLLLNPFFMESLMHFDREIIPESVVFAKGAGALGYFEVTRDITNICRAKLFEQVGKKTPLVARFSLGVSSKGGSDTSRDFRGFAVKLYTEDGNFDIVGLNTKMFFLKDPVKFPSYAHAFKRNPKTNLYDLNARWDYLTQNPEALFAFLQVMGDQGIPDGYRSMPGSTIHVFQAENEQSETSYVKLHMQPNNKITTLTSEEASKITGKDLDYATRDLYNAIENGDFPSWTLGIQVMSQLDVETANFDPFDITRVWSETDYPVRPIGNIVLTQNPDNYFATIEQVAFNPGNLVPGIRGIDKVFEARTLSYRDAQFYRLGSNPNKIQVNCPFATKARTYNRDGTSPVRDNERDAPNYRPNSFNGPQPYVDGLRSDVLQIYVDPKVNNFDQMEELYTTMPEDERNRLVENIVNSLQDVEKFLQERAIQLFNIIRPDFGHRIQYGLILKQYL